MTLNEKIRAESDSIPDMLCIEKKEDTIMIRRTFEKDGGHGEFAEMKNTYCCDCRGYDDKCRYYRNNL
jgi:hypothetical protein